MNDRIGELSSAFAEGRLDEAGAAELLRAAESDPSLADVLGEDLEMHRLLGLLHLPVRNEEREVGRILYYVRASREATGFYRRIQDRLRRRRPQGAAPRRGARFLRWVLGLAAVLLLAAGILALLSPSPSVGEILMVGGAGVRLFRGEAGLPARPGMALLRGDRLAGGPPGADPSLVAAAIRLGEGAEIDLGAGAELRVLSGGMIHLQEGRVYAAVRRPPFRLSTASAEITVGGTRFEARAEGGRTEIRVEEGRVEFSTAAGSRRVGALEGCSALAGQAPGPALPIRPEGIWRGRRGGGRVRALLGAGPAPADVRFPPGSGIVDVAAEYGARGDGLADDTAALQRALDENLGKFRILYFRNGVYRLTRPLSFGADRERAKQTVLQGQSREGTVLRLDDRAPGFGDPSRPVPLLSMFGGTSTSMAFNNAVRDLTLDVGRGNPGAAGIRWMASNVGVLENVTIRSSDPQGAGAVGLDLTAFDPGPCLFRNVRIEGFDVGVRAGPGLYGVAFEHLTLRAQRSAGIHNAGQAVTIRGLDAAGIGPPVVQGDAASVLFLMDAFLAGSGPSAILNRGRLHLRRVRQSGFARLVDNGDGTGVDLREVREYVSHSGPAVRPGESLGLPVEETPEVPWDPPETWIGVDATALGEREDDTEAVQKAMDRAQREGRGTVFFPGGLPQGTIRFGDTVRIPPGVRRVFGMDSLLGLTPEMRRSGKPLFRVEGEGGGPLVLERFTVVEWAGADVVWVEHASSRPLVLRHLNSYGRMRPYRGRPGAVLFVEDVCAGPWEFEGQRVWMRQIDVERGGVEIENRGGDLWILGLHAEGEGSTLVRTTGGGRTEVFGGVNCWIRRGPSPRPPVFVVEDARASFSLAGAAPQGVPGGQIFLREVRGGRVREVSVREADAGGRGEAGVFLGLVAEGAP